MDNPWPQLPTRAPYVLPSDKSIVKAFNERYANKHDKGCHTSSCSGCYKVQTHLLPEPFIGDPKARVYLLNLNPGYSPADDKWHKRRVYRTAIIDNLHRRPAAFPFYFLDPALKDAPGAKWWAKHARWLIDAIGVEKLARNLFCVELFPYHSKKYKPVPKSITRARGDKEAPSPDGLAPSSAYGTHLVCRAIADGRPIVAMRHFTGWCAQVPALQEYDKLFRLNSKQRAWLSPRNIEGYDRLVSELRDTADERSGVCSPLPPRRRSGRSVVR